MLRMSVAVVARMTAHDCDVWLGYGMRLECQRQLRANIESDAQGLRKRAFKVKRCARGGDSTIAAILLSLHVKATASDPAAL